MEIANEQINEWNGQINGVNGQIRGANKKFRAWIRTQWIKSKKRWFYVSPSSCSTDYSHKTKTVVPTNF